MLKDVCVKCFKKKKRENNYKILSKPHETVTISHFAFFFFLRFPLSKGKQEQAVDPFVSP